MVVVSLCATRITASDYSPLSLGVDMKNLLTITAVLEVGAGIVFLAIPSLVTGQLFGSSLETAAGLTLTRIAGVLLLSLGIACWLVHYDSKSRAARGLVGTLAFYNTAIIAVLMYANIGLGLRSSGLWPAVLIHAAMAVWCVM